MKLTAFLLSAALADLSAFASHPCDNNLVVSFVAGHDDHGYFVRAVRDSYPPGRGVGKGATYVGVAEYLAREAGAVVFFRYQTTWNDVPMKEWRGEGPVGTFRAFGLDTGIELVQVEPSWWVVGPGEYLRDADITITIHPADPSQQHLVGEDPEVLEAALVNQLPVRSGGQRHGPSNIELSYYWLTDLAAGRLLVVSDLRSEGSSLSYKEARSLHATRVAGGFNFSCLWEKDEIYGPLVPEVNEDFDGDGVRDPVLMGGPCGTKSCDAVILSGATGERLFEFSGNELAVEKSQTGPPWVAAEWSSSVDRGEYLSPRDRAEVRGERRHLVARFDPATRACLVDVRAGERAREQAKARRPGYDDRVRARDVLANVVGGLEKVRVYVFGPAHYDPASTSEQIKIERIFWQLDPPDALGFRHPVYQSRLVFRYRAPEVIEKEKEKESQGSLK